MAGGFNADARRERGKMPATASEQVRDKVDAPVPPTRFVAYPAAAPEKPLKLKLNWLAWQPTPYNDVLFRTISANPDFNLTVYYRLGRTATHPWKHGLREGYKSHVYHGRGLRLDLRLLKRALWERESVFVLAGWPGLTAKCVIVLLSLLRRPFIFWTDTPQVFPGFNSSGKPVLREHFGYNQAYPGWHALVRRWLYRLVFANAGAVMTTGKPGVAAYLALGCPEAKLHSMPFFVDLSTRAFQEPFIGESTASAPFVFTASGQLIPRKGFDVAIAALSLLRAKSSAAFRFMLVGDGPAKAELQRLARVGGIAREVRFLGWQEPQQVGAILRQSHVFVHPALYDPFPVAVLEAMAAGLPVLGADSAGSVRDRVIPNQNGFIHGSGDARSLADQMFQVMSDAALTRRMAKAARATAEEWPPSRALSILHEVCSSFITHRNE